MSHNPERPEKICLNCGAALVGRYCHVCGQENVEPRETVGHLVRHFFEDITHFDGKFFGTLRLLVTRPGFLSAEYIAGRRASYLNPVRMYMFISFVFFFTFFMLPGSDKKVASVTSSTVGKPSEGIHYQLGAPNGSPVKINVDSSNIKSSNRAIPTPAEYIASQDSLPRDKKDNAIIRYFTVKYLAGAHAALSGDKEYIKRTKEKFLHFLPQMFFVVLPAFAFFLYLLYLRHRKDFNYVAHAIFTVHFYCLVFISWLLMILLDEIPGVGMIAIPALFIWLCVYLFIAMRKFYKQGRGKTFLKYFILNSLLLVLFSVLSFFYLITAMVTAVE